MLQHPLCWSPGPLLRPEQGQRYDTDHFMSESPLGSTPRRRTVKPPCQRRKPMGPGSLMVAPRKPKHISLVVDSPTMTRRGGLDGLLGLLALLSNTASTSKRVSALTWIGSLKR